MVLRFGCRVEVLGVYFQLLSKDKGSWAMSVARISQENLQPESNQTHKQNGPNGMYEININTGQTPNPTHIL